MDLRSAFRPVLLVAGVLVALVLGGCGATLPARDVAATAATLQGGVDAEGRATTAFFEYGTSADYGSRTPGQTVSASATQRAVRARVTGLQPATTYHFRLCTTSSAGESCGEDRTFTTRSEGFVDEEALTGLAAPTAVRFASDGRIFVAEKSGVVKVFDGLGDAQPDVFADLQSEVDDYFDRGLLGLVLDPGFPAKPYVYVAYLVDTGCTDRFGQCPTQARISRLTATGDTGGSEKTLVQGGCFDFSGHSMDHLQFGADGALYASAGDGANYVYADWGQGANPCGDPPGPAGTSLSPPKAEGGALRAQDVRTTGDPTGLDGTILRIDPATGDGLPSNPLASSPDPMARRIVALGLRNPYRFTVRPGTNELWIADNGMNAFEELDRVSDPTKGPVNFGWPCYEGDGKQPAFAGAGLDLCQSLYADPGADTKAFLSYAHSDPVVAGDGCPTGSSSIGGPVFKPAAGPWPDRYDGALFFLDYARRCMWVMPPGADGTPDKSRLQLFRTALADPVDTQFGPDGNLYYASVTGGSIHRIRYQQGNTPPVAKAVAKPAAGPLPLRVAFDGSGSSDADPGDQLTYAWDLDGDGDYDDATGARTSRTYRTAGAVRAGLRVTDENGAVATDAVTVTAGSSAPDLRIVQPTTATRWSVGVPVAFGATATDAEDGDLPPSALRWQLTLHHCADNGTCHVHELETFDGVLSGVLTPPNHEYPAYLTLTATATDSDGLSTTKTVRIDPLTRTLKLVSDPAGLQLSLGTAAAASPVTRTVIDGSTTSVGAPTPQRKGFASYAWTSWSDGGEREHNVTVTADTTLTARFARAP